MNILKGRHTADSDANQAPDQELYRCLNQEILSVARDMPRGLQIPAGLQLLAAARRVPASPTRAASDFCAEFPKPLWSILAPAAANFRGLSDTQFATRDTGGRFSPERLHSRLHTAVRAQAMAFLLHIIDDHLCDAQARTDLLLLQLRTVVWNRFQRGVEALSAGDARQVSRVQGWIELYFESVYEPGDPKDIDEYLELARGQMAIWSVAPALLGLGPDPAAGSIESCDRIRGLLDAVSSAWRLTDDLEDWRHDACSGQQSALYHLSPPAVRRLWDHAGDSPKNENQNENQDQNPNASRSRTTRSHAPGGAATRDQSPTGLAAGTAANAGPERLRRELNAAGVAVAARRRAREYLEAARIRARRAGWTAIAEDLEKSAADLRLREEDQL